jgi:hypothetical protein
MQQRAKQAGFPHSFVINDNNNGHGAAVDTFYNNIVQYGEFSMSYGTTPTRRMSIAPLTT